MISQSNTKFFIGLTMSLPIQKSAIINCVATDSEIDSENYATVDLEIDSQLCRCQFLKSAAMVKSFWLYFSFILGVYISRIFYLTEEDSIG